MDKEKNSSSRAKPRDRRHREVHHRVKNNLQVIASILRMQERRESSPSAQGALRDAMNRLAEMVRTHERLSRGEDDPLDLGRLADVKNNLQNIASLLRQQMHREASPSAQEALGGAVRRLSGMVQVHDLLSRVEGGAVDLTELLDRLLHLNIQTFLPPGETILHGVRGDRVVLNADTATSVALAANELIINAIKHAFPGRRVGRLDVRVTQSAGELSVEVSDDGVGLPKSFDPASNANLGLRLVQSVVQSDLKGTLQFSGNRGTRVVFRFPQPRS